MARAVHIQTFLGEQRLAIAGVSRSGQKMGNAILRELKAKGRTVYPIHPEVDLVGEERCYRTFADLPETVGGVIVVVQPEQTLGVVREAHEAGIRNVWMQQGSESDEALEFCEKHGMNAVSRECIMMFAEPVESIHRFHRFVRRLFGRMPA